VGHPGAVAIVAIDDDDQVVFVRQYRLAAGAVLLEIPAGGLDPASDGTPEDPGHAARRELAEETGLQAGSWQALGSFFSAPGFSEELMHLFLATDLRPLEGTAAQDEDERLIVTRRPFADALAAADTGEIVDAKTLVGLYRVDRLRRRDR
jgi:ADP-ribose pyrophosphatase